MSDSPDQAEAAAKHRAVEITTLAQADDMQRLVHSVPTPVAIAMQP